MSPFAPYGVGVGGGGGGRTLGPAPNTFGDGTTADRAAAEALRDAQAATATWLALYANRNFLINLLWTGGGDVVQRRDAAGTGWEDVDDVIKGRPGTDGISGKDGIGINWNDPDATGTVDLSSATSSATAVSTGYMVDADTDFIIGTYFESAANDTEDVSAMTYVDASRLSTDNSAVTPLGQNDIMYLRLDLNRNLLLWRLGGDSGTYRFRVWEVPASAPGQGASLLSQQEIQDLINATSLSALQGQVTDGQIPDPIARDSEIPAQRTAAQIVALISGEISFSDIDGLIANGQVPDTFTRDAEITLALIAGVLGLTVAEVPQLLVGAPTLSGQNLTFTLNDGTTVTRALPAGMGGGTADGRLHFGSGVPASSLGINGGSYLGVTDGGFYEKEAGAWVLKFTAEGAAPVAAHTRYFGIKAGMSRVITTADLAAANTSDDDEGTFPANAAAGYAFIAVPEDQGEPTEFYRPPNPINQIGGLDRQAGTVDDAGGDAHIAVVSQAQYPISTAERPVRIGYS